MNLVGFLVAFLFATSCRRDADEPRTGFVDAGIQYTRKMRFSLDVEQLSDATVFRFFYPDRPARKPRVYELYLDRVDGELSCEVKVRDVRGAVLEGPWRLGDRSANLDSRGCPAGRLRDGEYELQLFTDRGEFRQRLTVQKGGNVVLLPWEEEPGIPRP